MAVTILSSSLRDNGGNELFDCLRLKSAMPVSVSFCCLFAGCDNKAYESWLITDTMDFEVFGRVLKLWQGVDLICRLK